MKRILALLTLGIVIAGCGQKGALYLPETTAERGETSVALMQPVVTSKIDGGTQA